MSGHPEFFWWNSIEESKVKDLDMFLDAIPENKNHVTFFFRRRSGCGFKQHIFPRSGLNDVFFFEAR